MSDTVQQALERLAIHNGAAWLVLAFSAAILVYLLGVAWLAIAIWRRRALSWQTIARIIILGVLAVVASKVLTHAVSDPRPYLVTHTHPLIPTSRDNGFPSDHVLLATALTASLWWIDRRWLWVFAVGTFLVAAGRLAVGAHHTLDVLGSVAIAVVAALITGVLPLPAAWQHPLLLPRPSSSPQGQRGSEASHQEASIP